jgi:putative addiction module component (TIGR02574 family)
MTFPAQPDRGPLVGGDSAIVDMLGRPRGVEGEGKRGEKPPIRDRVDLSMASKLQQVLQEALILRPRARAEVAGTLLRSLDAADDPQIEAVWAAEIERRILEVESGKVRLVPWERVRRQLTASLRP